MAHLDVPTHTTKLLAYNGSERNQRQGFLGVLLHDKSKWFIRKAVDHLHKKMRPIFEYKQENGWNMEHVAALKEAFDWTISLDDQPINKGIGGFKDVPGGDKNKLLFMQLRDIVCTQLDEDSHYSLRCMVMLKWIHEHWDRFEMGANQADHLLRFGEIYKDLLEASKKLPEDDGDDVEEYDMVAYHNKITGAK